MIEADVVVIGAGPAGAAAALQLAPSRRVLLIERRSTPPERIGESLPAAAHRLLRDLGLWDSFLAEGHAPCYANRSVWGGAAPVEQDTLRDPDGHGWHLDRVRFEQGLRAAAGARGASLLAPAHPRSISRRGDRWEIVLDHAGRAEHVASPLLIDAAGRGSTLLRSFGARRVARDKLICGWVHGIAEAEPMGVTYIEAEPDGWWYTAPLPPSPKPRRVLAFHTDADLPAVSDTRSARSLLARASRLSSLSEVLAGTRFDEDARCGYCAAHSAELVPAAGDGWFAAGDAALAFDPLASQGLFNALYTGLFAAQAAGAMLDGDDRAAARYVEGLDSIRDAYRTHLGIHYRAERRWRDNEFWRRRAA